jgi:uncharacterized protein (TIGR03067 family)
MAKYERSESQSEIVFEALQGDWRAVFSEFNGEMTPVGDFSTIVLTHKDNNFSVAKNGKVLHEGRYSLNTAVKPHVIALTYTKSANEAFLGGPRVGIAQLVGDTLKTVFPPVGQEPPKDFTTFPDSDLVLTVFQRAGSEKGTGLSVARTKFISQW